MSDEQPDLGFLLERIAYLERERRRWMVRAYTARRSRDVWKKRAHEWRKPPRRYPVAATFRVTGLSAKEGVGSLPSPSEDLSPVTPSAALSSTIRA